MKRVLLLLACQMVILVRVEDALRNPGFGPDKLGQLAGAVNLVEGHGVSWAYAEAQAPAVIRYQVLTFAPGYPWLVAVGLFLTSNLYHAVILTDLFFVLLQLTSATWLISLLPGIPSYAKTLWFCAFALNPSLVTTLTSTDLAAMGGYTLAVVSLSFGPFREYGMQYTSARLPVANQSDADLDKRRMDFCAGSSILCSFLALTLDRRDEQPSGKRRPAIVEPHCVLAPDNPPSGKRCGFWLL